MRNRVLFLSLLLAFGCGKKEKPIPAPQGGGTPAPVSAQQRDPGTKERPLVRFQETEQARLKPLPVTAYDLAIWKVVNLHRDCHTVFDKAYYSAPFRYVGQRLRVRGGTRRVRLYSLDYQLVASHPRAARPGERHTDPLHLPAYKVMGLVLERATCLTLAANIGPATHQVAATWLADRVIDRLPMIGRLLRLRERFGDARLEAACARAVRFDDLSYKTIKHILVNGLDSQSLAADPARPLAQTFVRTPAELVGHLFGGAPPQLQFLVQDATDLSQFADASKDGVIIFGVLHHIPEWRKVIDEIKRVLQPNGTIFLEEPRGLDLRLFDIFFRWGHPDPDFGLKAMEEHLKSRGFDFQKQWTPLLTMYRIQKLARSLRLAAHRTFHCSQECWRESLALRR